MLPLLASESLIEFKQLLIPITVITLSMSIPIVAIITDHLQKKERMRLMEKAIEHGANLESLDFEDSANKQKKLPYRSGMVLVAVGIALLSADRFVGIEMFPFHLPLGLGGLIVLAVGIALILNDFMNRDQLIKE
ncbi:MAG: hypothetical protein GY780_09510 [bacterium]|nr:hypothetical protein [bacterium]